MKLNYKQLTYIVGVLKEAKCKAYQEKLNKESALEEAKNDYYAWLENNPNASRVEQADVYLVKTVVDDNGKRNVIEKIPYEGEVSLKSAYELIGCETIDIKEVPFHAMMFRREIVFIPDITLIFDDEFLLKHSKPVVNELASMIFGQSLCGNVLLCETNEEGESFPFDEARTYALVKQLKTLGNHVEEMKFTVPKPTMTFMEF